MSVAIVTDSCSDITQEEARKHGITVVPVWVRFGKRLFRDGVDIEPDEFYRRMTTWRVRPQTAAPSPGEFVEIFEKIARRTKEIVSIHATRRHSLIYESAVLAKEVAEKDVRGLKIEVIDSEALTMWQGFIVYAARRAADTGATIKQVVDRVHEAMAQVSGIGLLDTFSYAVSGRRLGKVVSTAEAFLGLKPMVTLRDGEVRPVAFVRKYGHGVQKLREFISRSTDVEDIAIVHGTVPEEAESLAFHALRAHPSVSPKIVRLGAAVGCYSGPKTIMVITKRNSR